MKDFDLREYLSLLEILATTKGPSLGEGPRRDVLKAWLDNWNVDNSVDEAGNLWCHLHPGEWSETIVFDAHIDVVQQGFVTGITQSEEKIFGMGVCDNLTAVTLLAMLGKAVACKKITLKRPLKLLFSVGEEGDGDLKGVRQLIKDYPLPPGLLVSFDLSFDRYSVEALGSKRYFISIRCPGGHSWSDYGTPGAIEELICFFNELKLSFMPVERNNRGALSFNTGSIRGGEGINSISAAAEATFEFRSVDEALLKNMDNIVKELVNAVNRRKDVEAVCHITGERPAAKPVGRDYTEALVKRVLKGVCDSPLAVPRSTNINVPLKAGWTCLCMGLCKGGRYHSREEYVYKESVPKGWAVLQKITMDVAG